MNAEQIRGYERNDPHFIRDLRDSEPSVWLAAAILRKQGCSITIHPRRERPAIEQMAEYSDGGDIWIEHPRMKGRVEVKQRRNIEFTNAADYPFSTVIVDAAHLWDEASPKPLGYLIFNRAMTHYCKVPGRTFPSWKRVERMDGPKGRMRWFYLCPKELCEWRTVVRL